MKTKTETLIRALRILAEEIHSEDGVANAAIGEGADRLEELYDANTKLLQALGVWFDGMKPIKQGSLCYVTPEMLEHMMETYETILKEVTE